MQCLVWPSMKHRVCSQIVDADLIGATADASAALLSVQPSDSSWLSTAQPVLDIIAYVLTMLEAASVIRDLDNAVVNAGWRRCREVRLPQNLLKVHPLTFCMLSSKHPSLSFAAGPKSVVCLCLNAQGSAMH